MKTWHSVALLLVVGLPLRADEAEDRAVKAVQKLGGRIVRDEKADGKPIITVDLILKKVTAADLKELAPLTGLRHLDLAYRVSGGLAAGVDRGGLGWEGRLFTVGLAAAVGIAPLAYWLLGIYLWWRLARDWVIGWSARQSAISR